MLLSKFIDSFFAHNQVFIFCSFLRRVILNPKVFFSWQSLAGPNTR